MPRKTSDFVGFWLPEELVNEVEKFIKRTKIYRSNSEFVREAIRLRIEQIKEKEG